ncbi:MAG TPA: flagellar basal body L-ring protein FlgH [Hydrogenophaga sp.]|uniref:flagellar basal body L-ring protein FlgH n=1 Tax=Hydrogenophaga sp. TaxID=1904254 RepID=UPI002CE77C07|nr:flagellar basal body L-ring protein FlgH [Hydrogenophaga sp.]HMN92496.1 flagellar basal body L-ring protein FlgH [Hydrogenophaga sp.]HMP10466.1 flagellar basal body L-ring protein FlgH [Hydrogenophaga sp.]
MSQHTRQSVGHLALSAPAQRRARLLGLGAVLAALVGCASAPVDVEPSRPIRYVESPAPPAQPTGSLFQAARYRPAFEDLRARHPGDTVTIQIVERVSATQRSTSAVNRSGSVSGSVSALPLIRPGDLGRINNLQLGGSSENQFSGQGNTENANTFTGSITAIVQEVLPNGHLVVVGEKQLGVNRNVDVLRFSGVVDPQHIRPGNVVASAQVANARIESRGRGAMDEAQAIGWLSRVFLSVLPF